MQSADVCSADKKLASVLCGRECPREWFTEAIRLDDPHFLIFVDKHSTCRVSQSDLSDAAIDGRLKCVQMIIRHFKIVPNLDTMRLFVRKSCVPSSKLIDTFKVLKCAYGNQKPNYVIDIAKQQQRALYSLCPSYPSASLFAAIWKRDLEFLQTASTNKSTKFSKSMFKAYMRGFDESPESPAGLEVLDFLLERCTLTKKMRVEVLLQKNTRLLKLLRQSQELTESDQKIDASLPSGNKTKN